MSRASGAAPGHRPRVATLVTGGQSGVDRAAAELAIALGVDYGGWVPRGGWAEDAPHDPGVLKHFERFRPTDSSDPAVRTRRNVEDADATLVLVRVGAASAGTDLAVRIAESLGRPVARVDVDDPHAVRRLEALLERLPAGAALNVAGPRESECPGIHDAALAFLERHAGLLFGAT